jgi:cell wall-associated NlpC family hydrolase
MSAEPLLNAMDDLFGVSPVGSVSASAVVRALSNPVVPPSWRSPAAVGLDDRQGDIDSARNSLAQRDDATKAQLDAAGAAVRDGKTGMAQIKSDYRLNRDRLAGAPSPEMQAKLDELDRVRVQDGANTVRSTQARLPNLGGAQSMMGAPFQALPQALSGAAPQMLGAPLQAITPLTSALSGITIPQQIPHTLASPGASTIGEAFPGAGVGPGSERGQRIAQIALKQLGTPYVWGGGNVNGPTDGGFDCSGLAQYATYQATGIVIPRTTGQQISQGITIPTSQAQAGDLVFSYFRGGIPEHVQIALGNGQVVHAPQSNDVVRIAHIPAGAVVKRIA